MNKKLIWFISILVAVFLAFFNVPIASANKDIGVIKPAQNFMGSGIDKQKIPNKNDLFKRVIADGIVDEKDILHFKSKGCKLKHRLRRSSSFECPIDIIPELNVRESRIFHIIDLEADYQIKANQVWAEGINGEGLIVAILDSGIDETHIELQLPGNIYGQKDFVSNDDIAEDENGHGTHVAGIITANGIYQIEGNYATGVAPGARIFMLKVCDASGSCYEDDMEAAMEYVVLGPDNIEDTGDEIPAKVMSISIGGGNYGDHCDSDPLAEKVNWVVDNGITVVIAAGNEGSGVSAPACASRAIAVGAVDKYGIVPDWSNRGSALDIVAPGVDILSTYSCIAPGASGCEVYWYTYMSGTSMSAPHVSGVVALLLQAKPTATTEQIKNALYDTADPVNECCTFYFFGFCFEYIPCTTHITGAGIVNAYESYLAIKSTEPACSTNSECDDSNVCTEDVCISSGTTQTFCSNTPQSGTTCDDGLFCTQNDICMDVTCTGEAKDCSDGVACTVDNCDEVNDNCIHTPQDTLCDNSLYCDGVENCDAVLGCQQGTSIICSDGVDCTDDSCNESTDQCDYTPNDANCPDDGLFCNGNEVCDIANGCSHTGDPCSAGTTCNEETDTCEQVSGCGDGICAGRPYEDCSTCPSDCPGNSVGKPSNRWCCGNLVCESSETAMICPVDCSGGSCQCGEEDGCCPTGCISDPDCQCSGFKEICTVDSDCCTGLSCHPVKKYCR